MEERLRTAQKQATANNAAPRSDDAFRAASDAFARDVESIVKRRSPEDEAKLLAERAAVDARRRSERIAHRLANSGVPARYLTARLDDAHALPEAIGGKPVRSEWLDTAHALSELIDRPSTSLLYGPRGTGKTQMASALVNACCKADRAARYATMLDYVGAVQACYGGKGDAMAVERAWASLYLLVLDESNERRVTTDEQVLITRLVDKRYANNVATLLITNETAKEFQTSAGASIASRITDGGKILACNWPSVRGRQLTESEAQHAA